MQGREGREVVVGERRSRAGVGGLRSRAGVGGRRWTAGVGGRRWRAGVVGRRWRAAVVGRRGRWGNTDRWNGKANRRIRNCAEMIHRISFFDCLQCFFTLSL